jgi:predicted nucleic acid-binding Zn ribbon protein
MPIYQYETIPALPDESVERFEVRQHFSDQPLAVHPDTGVPVRRVISGGIGLLTRSSDASLPEPGPGCGPGSCGCGRFS